MNGIADKAIGETEGEGVKTEIATVYVSEVACLLHAYKDDDGRVHFKPECPTKADEKQLRSILSELYPEGGSEVIVEKAEIMLEGVKCESDVCKALGELAKGAAEGFRDDTEKRNRDWLNRNE